MLSRITLTFVLALAAVPASAAPRSDCTEMIATLQAYLDAHPDRAGTLRQTKEAQTQHQPTRKSVMDAKDTSRSRLVALLAAARRSPDNQPACRAGLAEAKRMLRP